jgi:hypothetical protein
MTQTTQSETAAPTYTITRERVTWIRDGKLGRSRITHPVVWLVAENGKDIKYFDTKGDAQEWIKAQ